MALLQRGGDRAREPLVTDVQPLYQIPGEMLSDLAARLGACASVQGHLPRLYQLLFVSGINLTFRCFKVELAEEKGARHLMPSHRLDDGLCDSARNCVSALVKRVKSREMREMFKSGYASGSTHPRWLAVKIAFLDFFDSRPWEVKTWIARGDAEENRIRLSCAMGIESLWHPHGHKLATDILRERPRFEADEFAAIDAFTLTRENALPDL